MQSPLTSPVIDRRDIAPLTLARPLSFIFGGIVVLGSALGWGRPGLVAGLLGATLSLVNVWALERLASRAVERALIEGPGAAASGLTSALGAKTIVLLVVVSLVLAAGSAHIATTPFGLGLLVSVFALVTA